MLAILLAGGRSKYDEVAATGWADADHEMPAAWVDEHTARMGGWHRSCCSISSPPSSRPLPW